MKKASRVSQLDNDKIVEMSGGNRFNLVIMAAARSREIRRQNKDSQKFEHIHSNVTALLEFQNGTYGADYIKKVKFDEPNDRRRDHGAKYIGR